MNRIVMLVVVGVLRAAMGEEYVDLRTNYITKGVRVYQGSFGVEGRYRMFVGDEEPLEKVKYDGRIMFPRRRESRRFNLVVEVFDNRMMKHAIIHKFYHNEGVTRLSRRSIYELQDTRYKKKSELIFVNKVNQLIRLSVDIGRENKNPIIKKEVICQEWCKEIYTIGKEFNGRRLEGIEAPNYTFGAIYDSRYDIAVGYTKMDVFVNSCDSFVIEKRKTGDVIRLEYGATSLAYEMRMLMERPVWLAQITKETIVIQEEQGEAMEFKEKIDGNRETIMNVALDVSERITPELFGIDKVTGYVGNGKYTMYEMKKEYLGRYRIAQVVDTRVKKMIIQSTKKSVFTKVEVYQNYERKIVVIHVVQQQRGNFVKKRMVYKKAESNGTGYRKLNSKKEKELIDKLEKIYPIRVRLHIDEEAKSIYDKGETVESNGVFEFYHIKGWDQLGVTNREKYTFGSIWAKNEYEIGNIPAEKYRQIAKEIKGNIAETDLMVTKYENDMYVDMKEREAYSIMML